MHIITFPLVSFMDLSEKVEGCNFHYYLPFVKEPFPLSDHPMIESHIGLKSPIPGLKDTHSFCAVQPILGRMFVHTSHSPVCLCHALSEILRNKTVGELAAVTVLQLSLHRLSSSHSSDCKTYLSASSRNGQVKRPPKSVALMLHILQTIL